MVNMELVVARYREDLAWLRRVPRGFSTTVYDKGGDWRDAVALPNVGQESHTYLQHLVSRYDSLAETTVFCQGRPFDHVPDFHRRLARLVERGGALADFDWWGFVVDLDDRTGSRLFRTWSKNADGRSLDLAGFCSALWPDEPVPEQFVFFPGAHFVVSKRLAISRPRSWYQRALDLSVSVADAGHCLERTWDRVFGVDGIPPDLRARALPVYLRPVRRLGITWDDVPAAYRPW